MNERQVTCVLELARTLNFNQAARNLGMSQPSLSYQIRSFEEEVGFRVFDRTDRKTSLTPGGTDLCDSLRILRVQFKEAVERAQNISRGFSEAINMCLSLRSSMHLLPEIVARFDEEVRDVRLNVSFVYSDALVDMLVRGQQDVVFASASDVEHFRDVRFVPLYTSSIYAVMRSDDPLASRESVSLADLSGRTVIVGGGATRELETVQRRLVSEVPVRTLNATDPDAAMTYVESGRGVVLAPGITNDMRPGFSWVPVDETVDVECGLAVRADDDRESLSRLVSIAMNAYAQAGRNGRHGSERWYGNIH